MLDDNIASILQENNALIKADTEIQVKIAKRVISTINDAKVMLSVIDTNIINVNNTLSSFDFIKPFEELKITLTEVVGNQKELDMLIQNSQDLSIQGFNSILEMHNINLDSTHVNMDKLLSKVNDVRNQNLDIYRQ